MHSRPGTTFILICVICALCGIALFILAILPAQASGGATITVNSAADPSEFGNCTLRDAIENANNNNGGHASCATGSGVDTIIFSNSISTITLNSVLPPITGILTLYGGQNAGKNQIVSGQDTYGIFSVASGATLIVDRITLTHGNAFYGGAITANLGSGSSTVVISESLFTRNQASFAGGAIDINSGMLTVTHSTFSNNQAVKNSGDGGAINISGAGGTAYIKGNSYFYENSSINGGAINATAALHLRDTVFNINTASGTGGALYLSFATMNMVNCTREDSEAARGGGAIFAPGGIATISGTEFDANRLTNASSSYGGAIFSLNSNRLSITDSIFFDNYSPARGGAIASSSELTVTNTTFQEDFVNDTDGWGGGIYLMEQGIIKSKARLESSTFFGNIAYSGGALDNNDSVTQITNSEFYANSVEGYGSAIYLGAGAITVTHSTIAGNSAPSAIDMNTSDMPTMRHSLISNNMGVNCSFTVIDGGYNLQFGGTDPDSCSSSIEIGDPQFAPLADNGGSTWTMLFQNGLAIDRIPGESGCGVGLYNDQRGFFRPIGTKCDIGAVESYLYLYLPTIRK